MFFGPRSQLTILEIMLVSSTGLDFGTFMCVCTHKCRYTHTGKFDMIIYIYYSEKGVPYTNVETNKHMLVSSLKS